MNVASEVNEKATGSGFPDLMSRARHGKIARLPRHLREEINRRLDENQSGVKILAWINAQPEVGQILESQFGGKPINLQNLSNWRREGFTEWLRYRFATEEVDGLVAGSSGRSLQEAVINPLEKVMAVQCLVTYHQATQSSDPLTKFKYLCQGMHEINAMRRHEHRKAWQAFQEEKESYGYARACRTQSHSHQSQSQHIKVDQGEKFELRATSNIPRPTSNIQRNTNSQAHDSIGHAKAWTPSAAKPSEATQSNPSKSGQIKVDQGEEKISVAKHQTSGSAGTDLVSKAIAEIFGAQPSGNKAIASNQPDSTIQRFNDSTPLPARGLRLGIADGFSFHSGVTQIRYAK